MNKPDKFWDRTARRSNKSTKKFEHNYSKTAEIAKKYLNKSDVVLDFACGSGSITCEIADHVEEIHAIDSSLGMIELAKRRGTELGIENLNFTQSTIFNDGFKKESFDAILAFNILHLVEDQEKVIQKINELLKPGGLFISATSCLGEKIFMGSLLSLMSRIRIVPYIKNLKTAELEDLITNGSFKIVHTEILYHSSSNYYIVAKKF